MDGKEEKRSEGVSAESRAQWSPPEVDRMVAGAAEGAADISSDGIDIPS